MLASLNARNILSWILAARPKTLIAGMSPVLIAGSLIQSPHLPTLLLCLGFSMALQIGANLANDYFDFIKGADNSNRIGPKRAAQSGWIPLEALKWGIFVSFLLAAVLSVPLLIRIGWIGSFGVLLSIACALLYTGGPRPLGYLGLGELLVFFFYGPIATCGTYYALTFSIDPLAWAASISPGFLSAAILIANNLRDEQSDRAANKKTLVVRFGQKFGKFEYCGCLLAAFLWPIALVVGSWAPIHWLYLTWAALPAASLFTKTLRGKTAPDFAPLLPQTALILSLYTALFCLAF